MDFASMNKTALRAACKDARISYGGMSNDQMRAALEAAQQAALDALGAEQAELDARNAAEAARAAELAAMGEFGAGTAEAPACPHCGINHIDNGFCTRDDEVANKPGVTCHMEGMNEAYECLGCLGRWGDVAAPYAAPKAAPSRSTGTGLKIEKVRIERNGIKQPSIGGACRSVWDACSEMQALDPSKPLTVKQVKEHATTMEWNANNAVIEFYRWRKWAAPTLEEIGAAPVGVEPETAVAPAPEGDAPQA
jgi:hypothetical protein